MAFLTDEERSTLVISKAIFHVVGSLDSDFVALDVEFDPQPHADFFIDRIDATARGTICDFRPESNVLATLRRIEATPSTFVKESQGLARAFAAKHRANAKKGVFFLFMLATATGPLAAMLKLDHQPVLAYRLRRKNGLTSAEIDEVLDTFVRSPDALQKGTIVRLRGTVGELVVHDLANRRGISQYFEDFLDSRRRFTPADLTKRVVDIARTVAASHRAELDPDIAPSVISRIYGAAQAGVAFGPDEPQFLTAAFGPLPEDAPVIKAFQSELRRAGIEDESFALDPELTPPPNRTRILTVENIEIRFPASAGERVAIRKARGGGIEIVVSTAKIVENDALA